MKNLDQIRAKNALDATRDTSFAGKDGGMIAKKIPTMIRENGIMATLAFALEKKGKGASNSFANNDMKLAFDCIVKHLSDSLIGKITDKKVSDAESWLKYLAEDASSSDLREQTAEAMAYLGYFRRFASKN